MGMYDTIHFDKIFLCPECNGEISNLQTKEFENVLYNYHIHDCVDHAESSKIVKERLWCDTCRTFQKNIYVTVFRGILIGCTETYSEAKNLLDSFSFEKLIFWYHDLFKNCEGKDDEKVKYRRFIIDVYKWFSERNYDDDDKTFSKIQFFHNAKYFENAIGPIDAIGNFLTYDKMISFLKELQNQGVQTLEIYYPEIIEPGEEIWSVDVYQDRINNECNLNWTWTVISKKGFEQDERQHRHLESFEIIVDEKFSQEVIVRVIKKWLSDRNFDFGVIMIPPNEAEGSGMLKNIRSV